MNRTFRVRVTVRDAEFDFGAGPGVLGWQDISYDNVEDRNDPIFVRQLLEDANNVLDNFIILDVGEIVENG